MKPSELTRRAFHLLCERQFEAAECLLMEALGREPTNVDALTGLGLVARHAGQLEKAAEFLGKALQHAPDSVALLADYGDVQRQLGAVEKAREFLVRALSIDASLAEVHSALGATLQILGDFDQARHHYETALRLAPQLASAHINLGYLNKDQGKLDEAVACYRKALEIDPSSHVARNNLGSALKDQGLIAEAIRLFAEALAIHPSYCSAYSNLLLTLHYSNEHNARDILAASREFARRFEAPLQSTIRSHQSARDPQRFLRVGYVSADFRRHPVSQFISPILERHDRKSFEVHCYYNGAVDDAITLNLKCYADRWTNIFAMADDAVAERIREDGIDVLVDLGGHTAGNRLMVFARKPAPVQITYLGYLGTTGLKTMDYRITDRFMDPAGFDANYSEQLLRLPETYWCFRPSTVAPVLSPLPADANGYVTLGNFNNVAKVNESVVALWARVLHRLQSAKLLLVAVTPGGVRDRMLATFARQGIPSDRLILVDWLPEAEFAALHSRFDIALDPFPYNGGTTTCNAMWAGVPVVSLAGRTFASRAGVTLLSNTGLSDLIAYSDDDYVDIVNQLAADWPRLRALRAGVRDLMLASPIMNEMGFVKSLESIYRRCWRDWCERH